MKRNDLAAFLWICSYTCLVFGGIFAYTKFTIAPQEKMISMHVKTKDVEHAFTSHKEPTITVILQKRMCDNEAISQPICLKGL